MRSNIIGAFIGGTVGFFFGIKGIVGFGVGFWWAMYLAMRD